ncbi:alpha/beta fold hydrolase [Mycobacterium sp. G7A2]|uniref:alpha/beta fold hydrolase n=1 Tax=Mycobacterium sp. G7A2 TaxID=3317307 RepID=UPI0035A893C7
MRSREDGAVRDYSGPAEPRWHGSAAHDVVSTPRRRPTALTVRYLQVQSQSGQPIVVADSVSDHHAFSVVALPGWKGTDLGLRAVLTPLVANGYRTLTVNLPGNGVSQNSITDQRASISSLSKLTIDVIESIVGRRPVVLLGHSFGATIAAAAAAQSSNVNLLGLILISPVACVPSTKRVGLGGVLNRAALSVAIKVLRGPMWTANIATGVRTLENVSNSMLARRGIGGMWHIRKNSLRERGFAPSPKDIADQLTIAASNSCLDSASRITAPTVIIAGDRDPMSTAAEIDRLASTFGNCEVHLITGAGHLAHHEDRDCLSSLVLSSLLTIG